MADITIKNVLPKAALPGGEVVIEYAGRELAGTSQPEVRFGDFSAQVTMASSDHIIAKVPEPSAELGTSELVVATNGDTSRPFPYEIGKKLAANLHPVANPAIDGEGNIYATYSGRRGQKTPVSIYKVTPKGAISPFVTDIMNATGLAYSLNGSLFVSSRFEGNVYRVDPSGRTELFIEGMGIATGIAFDHDGNLYVGDRSGSIFKISATKEIFVFATLEPSIAAYHMAFGFDDYLYVAGPTTSSFDSIYRISPSGEVDRFFTGLGRPQGLAFDIEGHLYSVASYRGRRGIFRFREPGKPELVVAGLSLVGLAFDLEGNLMVVDSGALYRVRLGMMGKPLP
ncbi:MAG TPA: IPT/TIG domain-containing protein [Terriglobia bacterium]|nr:IPT/TIG domain-containing protein [Terriglobia bacterium]